MGDIKLGTGLFILRHEAEKDLFGVLERIAALGYDGVEFVGFFGKEPEAIKEKLDALGMKAIGNHVPADKFEENPDKTIAEHKALGCDYITIAWPGFASIPPVGAREFPEILGLVRKLSAECVRQGITPLYHNHDFEFNGTPSIFALLLDGCADEGLCAEPDLGWMTFAGADPAEYLIEYRNRTPVIHLKDVDKDEEGKVLFRPTGYGVVNTPRLMPLCLACKPKWLMIDHDDAYDRDAYDDLALSLEYVKDLMRIVG
ncbi:MAG: sugar phosphate isomerase/epimerase family protein [Oscillospiraceae bacterium]